MVIKSNARSSPGQSSVTAGRNTTPSLASPTTLGGLTRDVELGVPHGPKIMPSPTQAGAYPAMGLESRVAAIGIGDVPFLRRF